MNMATSRKEELSKMDSVVKNAQVTTKESADEGQTDQDKDEDNVTSEDLLCIVDTETNHGQFDNGEIRIVLVGRTGSGKSSLGNNILQQQVFESAFSPQSVTIESKRAECELDGKKVIVVDTPGFFNTRLKKNEVKDKFIESLQLVSPGLHVVLYVSRIGRYSTEEMDSLKEFVDIFGKEVFKHTIVVFVGKESLMQNGMEEYLESLPSEYLQLIEECDGRLIAFNNRADSVEKGKQVNKLFTIISTMPSKNISFSFINDQKQTLMPKTHVSLFKYTIQILAPQRRNIALGTLIAGTLVAGIAARGLFSRNSTGYHFIGMFIPTLVWFPSYSYIKCYSVNWLLLNFPSSMCWNILHMWWWNALQCS